MTTRQVCPECGDDWACTDNSRWPCPECGFAPRVLPHQAEMAKKIVELDLVENSYQVGRDDRETEIYAALHEVLDATLEQLDRDITRLPECEEGKNVRITFDQLRRRLRRFKI